MDKHNILKLGFYLLSITGWFFLTLFIVSAFWGDGKVLLNFNSIEEHFIEAVFIICVFSYVVIYGLLDYLEVKRNKGVIIKNEKEKKF